MVELIRETSSSLPDDVERVLKAQLAKEKRAKNAAAVLNLSTILENVALARRQGTPLCQDTGTLTFFVDERLRRKVTPAVLKRAVAIATERGYLRRNTIDSVSGKSYDDNVTEGAPVVHYVAAEGARRETGDAGVSTADARRTSSTVRYPLSVIRCPVTLLMKGGGSENMSRQYSLPDRTLGAGRDLAGVRKCLLDAVVKTQGYGCAPGVLGVCIGGDRATGFETAKLQLLRPLDEKPAADASKEEKTLRRLEAQILREANTLGIGPMGLGGKTTLLGVKIASRPRVPASFFVTIAYLCWAARRRTVYL